MLHQLEHAEHALALPHRQVSAEDAEAMRHILAAGLKAEVWGFARATKDDVDVLLQTMMKHGGT